LRPRGTQETLQRLALRGVDAFDPQRKDLFARFVELRRRKSSDALDDERRSTGYKVIANSGAYGVFAETNLIDVDTDEPGRKARRVTVYAETTFESEVDRPERPGRFSFFPTASLVTAGARLMLALAQHCVGQAGGEVAYCDTDGAAIVATKDGGFVPCEGGPYRLADGTRAVHALSSAQLDAIRERFAALNPYDREACPAQFPSWKTKTSPTSAARSDASSTATRSPRSSMPSSRWTNEVSRLSASVPRTSLGSIVHRFRVTATAGLSTPGSARFAPRSAGPLNLLLGSNIRQARSLR
jgi:hypothetical protein